MDTTATGTETGVPCTSNDRGQVRPLPCTVGVRASASKGTRGSSSTGTPMSTVTRPSALSFGESTPLRVCTRMVSLSVRPLSCT
jgi:hypothetical protein